MKILTPDEMRAADTATFERVAVPSRAVMESAGRHSAEYLVAEYSERLEQGVLVLAGAGNNGGDGFVLARALLGIGITTELYCLKPVESLTGDVAENARAFLTLGGKCRELSADSVATLESAIKDSGVLVDALFGTGLSTELRAEVHQLISRINTVAKAAAVPIFSIDIPSGVNAETGEICGVALEAHTTVALQCLKVGQVLFPGAAYCGETVCLDIGVSERLEEIEGVTRELITERSISELVQSVFVSGETAHKGTRGHLLVVGGSLGHYGAPKLSAHAGLVCGAGLVTLALPQAAAQELGPTFMEIMCASLADDSKGGFAAPEESELQKLCAKKSAFVVGPGLGQDEGAKNLLAALLRIAKQDTVPTVIDADALNLVSVHEELQQLLGPHFVLTPHPGEMSRLCGTSVEDVESRRLSVVAELAERFQCYVILKGARSILSSPSAQIWINPAAVPTLATGGSGDVLSGILGALLTRGGSLEQACTCGLFLHGAAGELCFQLNGGEVGALASDIARASGMVLNTLSRMPLFHHGFVRPILPGAMRYLPQFFEETLENTEH